MDIEKIINDAKEQINDHEHKIKLLKFRIEHFKNHNKNGLLCPYCHKKM